MRKILKHLSIILKLLLHFFEDDLKNRSRGAVAPSTNSINIISIFKPKPTLSTELQFCTSYLHYNTPGQKSQYFSSINFITIPKVFNLVKLTI